MKTKKVIVMNAREYVLDLTEKLRGRYGVWDRHSTTDPELADLGLLNIHQDSDRATMAHVRFGNFVDKDNYYFRADNPETRHRFYVAVPANDREGAELMLKILYDAR